MLFLPCISLSYVIFTMYIIVICYFYHAYHRHMLFLPCISSSYVIFTMHIIIIFYFHHAYHRHMLFWPCFSFPWIRSWQRKKSRKHLLSVNINISIIIIIFYFDHAFPFRKSGHRSGRRTESIPCPEGRRRHHHRVTCSTAAALPANPQLHLCREEFHHHLPPSSGHDERADQVEGVRERGRRIQWWRDPVDLIPTNSEVVVGSVPRD